MLISSMRIVLAFNFLLIGCSSESSSTKRVSSLDVPAPIGIEAGSLAIIVVNELNENLANKTSLTATQAFEISTAAAQSLQIEKVSLRLLLGDAAEDYEKKIEDFIDEIIEGSLDALDRIEVIHQRQLNQVLEEIVSSIMNSLTGRTDHLDESQLFVMLQSISQSAIYSLDEAGFSLKNLAEGARIVASSAIGDLDDTGLLTEERSRGILIAIVTGAIRGLADTSLANVDDKATEFSTVLDYIMYGVVGALDDAGIELEDIDDAIEHAMYACVSNIDDLGFTANEYEQVIESCIHGSLDALRREAGVIDPLQIEEALGFAIEGAVEGLAESQLAIEEMDEIIFHIVYLTIEHLDNIGIPNADTKSAVKVVLNRTILGLILAGFEKEHIEEIGDIVGDATLAAIEGLAELGFEDQSIEDMFDEIIHSLFSPLKTHGFSRDECLTIAGHFKTSLSLGLSSSNATAITFDDSTISSHVSAALDDIFGLALL